MCSILFCSRSQNTQTPHYFSDAIQVRKTFLCFFKPFHKNDNNNVTASVYVSQFHCVFYGFVKFFNFLILLANDDDFETQNVIETKTHNLFISLNVFTLPRLK